MKIQFWSVGKSHEPYIREGVEIFTKRISNYYHVEWNIIPVPKNSAMLGEADLRKKEGDMILDFLHQDDHLILLEESGKMLTSPELAEVITRVGNAGRKKLVFLIGGAYGVSDSVKERAQLQWSLSKLVFPHQLVRLILAEQVYRACSIIRNEKYHH